MVPFHPSPEGSTSTTFLHDPSTVLTIANKLIQARWRLINRRSLTNFHQTEEAKCLGSTGWSWPCHDFVLRYTNLVKYRNIWHLSTNKERGIKERHIWSTAKLHLPQELQASPKTSKWDRLLKCLILPKLFEPQCPAMSTYSDVATNQVDIVVLGFNFDMLGYNEGHWPDWLHLSCSFMYKTL